MLSDPTVQLSGKDFHFVKDDKSFISIIGFNQIDKISKPSESVEQFGTPSNTIIVN